ncbi:MAG: selenium metabolism-associated LysR family transcriptional regulator [Peptococcaceae bacterium]
MDIKLLNTFIAVLEMKSFSLAGKRLHLTQPAITKHIHLLEDYYGVKLLQRTNREFKVTPAGNKLYSYSKQIMSLLDETKNELSNLGGLVQGSIVISCGYSICENILPHIISAFQAKYPEIKITVKTGNFRHVINNVLDGEADVALIAGCYDNKSIVSVHLFTDQLVLIVGKNHDLADRTSISIHDVTNEKFILREQDSTTYEVFEFALEKAGISMNDINIFVNLESHEAIKRLVENNVGVSILSKWAITNELKVGSIKAIPIEELKLIRDFNLIYPKQTNKTALIKKLVSFCKIKSIWDTRDYEETI